MKRLILLLALVAGGAGCNSGCDDLGDLALYWNFAGASGRVEGDFGQTATGCEAATVDEILVTVGGITDAIPCDGVGNNGVPGVLLPGFPRGDYEVLVQAVRADEVVFEATGTARVRSCGETVQDVTLRAVPATMLVFYDFLGQPPQACFAAGSQVATVTYELRDGANRTVETTCNLTPQGACVHEPLACNAPSASFYTASALQLGTYAFAYVDAVSGGGATLLSGCGKSVLHDGFPVLVDLDTVGECAVRPADGLAPAAGPAL